VPDQADRAQADAAVIASLEHALADARAQYALLRRTLDAGVAHRGGISVERA
jgi:hypothetical protein